MAIPFVTDVGFRRRKYLLYRISTFGAIAIDCVVKVQILSSRNLSEFILHHLMGTLRRFQAGLYYLQTVDYYISTLCIIVVCFGELCALAWLYGEQMNSKMPQSFSNAWKLFDG